MKMQLYPLLVFLLLLIFQESFAQDSTLSLAFKKNKPPASYPLFYIPDLSYKLQQQFHLIRMANSGDPLAQHELGLRYLQGVDVIADTQKAAEWIGKAAHQELPSACYNYAILLLNGWGLEWNPFEAFKNFKKAADEGMPQAQYITGLFYTENLVVRQNRNTAMDWFRKASEKGFEPASELIKEIKQDTLNNAVPIAADFGGNNSPLIYIDFEFDTASAKVITEADLLKALSFSGISGLDSISDLNMLDLNILEDAASIGCPEALTILGYLYENGKRLSQNLIRAGIYYYLASKLDSRNAIYSLWKLNGSVILYQELEKKVKEEDPEAFFLLYGLKSLGLTDLISDIKARELLFKSASEDYRYAVLETGVNIYSGRYNDVDRSRGIDILKKEILKGDLLAEQRFISISIIDSSYVTSDQLKKLFMSAEKGSILAETLIGLCYYKGLGVNQDTGNASKYFRKAAQRGSNFAFQQLRQLYDKIRPDQEIFSIK